MGQYKHICNLEYCKKHSKCIFHNVISSLKANAYEVSLGGEKHSDIIICYQKEDVFPVDSKPESKLKVVPAVKSEDSEWREILPVLLSKSEQPHCENPSCNSLADLKYNGKVHLCFKCLDSLREHKSNHELARYFKHKYQVVKLLKVIDEFNNPKEKVTVRCSNIYCCSTEQVTQHHLIPNPYRKGVVGAGKKIPLCWGCHVRVHGLRLNHELALNYNTKSAVIKLLEEDTLFRLYKMRVIPNVPALPKREMTMVALNSVPSRMVAVAG